MKDIKEELRNFNRERDWDQFHTPENPAKSINIEATELLECFQWDDDIDLEQERRHSKLLSEVFS